MTAWGCYVFWCHEKVLRTIRKGFHRKYYLKGGDFT